MARRLGQFSLELPSRPAVLDRAALGGKTEGEGPLGAQFDEIFPEAKLGEENWEQAEAHLLQSAIRRALAKAHCAEGEIGLLFGGDLLNQCIATGFALRALGIPLAGLYGACSTFALSAALAALALDGGGFTKVMAAASSHFCAAEKQFRFPLEYGGQAPPSAQRTATAAAALLLGGGATEGSRVRVSCVIFGRVRDLGVSDANEMGAAMAPAACDTLLRFLKDTNTAPTDYDCILTGDLGEIGSALLRRLAKQEAGLDLTPMHRDGGLLLYDTGAQDVGAGGSGAGCSAAVLSAGILPQLESGALRRVLFLGTGALLSTISPLQGETIPAIAHGVLFESTDSK